MNEMRINMDCFFYVRSEQDKGFDTLGEIITKQRHMAIDIGNEIEVQNEILDDIDDAMEETDQRLTRNTRNIRRVSVKSNTCGLWVVIVILFVANLVVAIMTGNHSS